MHKAITVIQLKLEGQLIRRHPEWKLSHRDLFSMVDFANGTITIDAQTHKLLDGNFPTVDPADPLALTEDENELMTILQTRLCTATGSTHICVFIFKRLNV